MEDPRLIVGFDLADDAGVVRLDAERALVQTVDFFTPIVDDPFTWGAIAAANALSDVYAMGGEPLCAMNIVGWPRKLDPAILAEVLRGGASKVAEAGAILVGGHSVKDEEPKYGLAVTGLVHPDRVWANAGARPGDALVLTKPLGIGVLTTAIKRGRCPPEAERAVVEVMLRLNRAAADAARPLGVHGATDITGYGLLGHALEIARASGVSLRIDACAIPLLPEALALAAEGVVPGAARDNRAAVEPFVRWGDTPEPVRALLVDPQTSGGLLLCLDEGGAAALVAAGVGVRIGSAAEGVAEIDLRTV